MPVSPRELLEEAQQLKKELVDLRRTIHCHPELSFEELSTSNLVARTLQMHGYSPLTEVGGTGVVADTPGNNDGKVVAIRADMDALPIQETNKVSYASREKGVMHACGHDAHTAMGLGAAILLQKFKPQNGKIRFLFQPAEEATNSDGKSGATLMIEDQALDDVENIVAVHVFPDIPAGSVGLRKGPLLAACDKFDIRIQGKGCHGAYPHLGLDAVVIAAQVIQAIQSITSRRKSALEPAIVTVGGIKSNTYRSNIISDYVDLTGTVRYFHKETIEVIRQELTSACRVAESLGGSFEITYVRENPPVFNDCQVTDVADQVAREMLGDEAIMEPTMQMGAEDFSFLSEHRPSCFMVLGAEIEGDRRMLHTETFDIDEQCLPIGAAMLASTALKLLDA